MKPQLRWFNEGIDRGTESSFGPAAGNDADFRVWQLTNSSFISFNVYCEQMYASVDGRRIAFVRLVSTDFIGGPYEVWVADLESHEVARVDENTGNFLATTPFLDTVYYIRAEGKDHRLVRLNLKTLERDDVFLFGDCPKANATSVSPDERYYIGSTRLHDNVFGLFRVDLQRGKWEIFHEREDISNPHLQFEPAKGEEILVQVNTPADRWEESTLYAVSRDGKRVRPLPVGKPHTLGIDGHQCWIGKTGKVLLTTEDSTAHGNTFVAAPGDAAPTLLFKGFHFIHISASQDGRFFVADAGRRVWLGSLETGRVLPFCDPKVSWGSLHYTHPHAYITPGNRHVIYNSDRTGICQVFAAEVPPAMLDYLSGTL